MDINQYIAWLRRNGEKIDELMRRRMPVKVGAMAVSHFKENFRREGFVDGGLHPWKPAKRKTSGRGAAKNRRTLTSGRNHLMNSLQYAPGDYRVVVSDPVVYAGIHNEGGVIDTHPAVTPKMRKMAWARYYAAMGGKKATPGNIPKEAERWKRLALTKKTRLNIRIAMPRRRFLGESRELTAKINAKLEDELTNLMRNS